MPSQSIFVRAVLEAPLPELSEPPIAERGQKLVPLIADRVGYGPLIFWAVVPESWNSEQITREFTLLHDFWGVPRGAGWDFFDTEVGFELEPQRLKNRIRAKAGYAGRWCIDPATQAGQTLADVVAEYAGLGIAIHHFHVRRVDNADKIVHVDDPAEFAQIECSSLSYINGDEAHNDFGRLKS